jgi:hypothetical protein
MSIRRAVVPFVAIGGFEPVRIRIGLRSMVAVHGAILARVAVEGIPTI